MSIPVAPSGIAALLEHSAWIRRLAWSLVRDDSLADDLAQEAWLVALRHPPTEGLPARPWLGEVVRNLVRMRARGERRRNEREKATQVGAETHVDSADQLVEQVETQRTLAGLVVRLEEPYRSTILLRYHEGMSAADIATRQHVPPGTVRWRLKQGLERLRVELDRSHGGDRRLWQAALAPFGSAPIRQGGASGISAASTIKGVLAMKALIKIVVLIAGVAVALFVAAQDRCAADGLRGCFTGGDSCGRFTERRHFRANSSAPVGAGTVG